MEQFILQINIFSNIYLIAISIMVQFIIYPSFKNYSESTFKSFHSAYTKKMLFIVGPIMILELLSTLYLVIKKTFFSNFNCHIDLVNHIFFNSPSTSKFKLFLQY